MSTIKAYLEDRDFILRRGEVELCKFPADEFSAEETEEDCWRWTREESGNSWMEVGDWDGHFTIQEEEGELVLVVCEIRTQVKPKPGELHATRVVSLNSEEVEFTFGPNALLGLTGRKPVKVVLEEGDVCVRVNNRLLARAPADKFLCVGTAWEYETRYGYPQLAFTMEEYNSRLSAVEMILRGYIDPEPYELEVERVGTINPEAVDIRFTADELRAAAEEDE